VISMEYKPNYNRKLVGCLYDFDIEKDIIIFDEDNLDIRRAKNHALKQKNTPLK
jgi:hypothetical protein